MSSPAPRALYLSSFAPRVTNGRSMRTYTILRALARLGPVDVAFVPFDGDGPDERHAALEDVRYLPVRSSRGARRALRYALTRAQRVPSDTARAVSPELVATAERLGAEAGRGLVVATDLSSMVACRRLARRRPVVYAAHNVHHTYAAGSAGSPVEMRDLERWTFGAARESWMVSRRDIALARELVPGGRYRYVPNVVDVAGIEPSPPRPREAGPRREVLMVGDHLYEPNAEGARWLVREVLPLVRAQRPDVRLTIVGRGAEDVHDHEPGVEVPGFVDDLAARYHAADVVAVPLLEGGGTPLKFVEALAYGVPVVATPVAAQGLDVEPGRHFRLGADAPAFAAQLTASLEGDDGPMAAAARELAEHEYSVEALVRLLREDVA